MTKSKYSSTTFGPLVLPNRQELPARTTTDVENLDTKHPVVKGWLKAGALVKGKLPEGAVQGEVEVPIADLESPVVKKAIEEAVADAGKVSSEQLDAVSKAWENFKTLPDGSSNEEFDKAQAAIDSALTASAAA